MSPIRAQTGKKVLARVAFLSGSGDRSLQLRGVMKMSEGQLPGQAGSIDARPVWRAPVIDQDSIADSTRHFFNAPGIDRYEGSNPVGYGS